MSGGGELLCFLDEAFGLSMIETDVVGLVLNLE